MRDLPDPNEKNDDGERLCAAERAARRKAIADYEYAIRNGEDPRPEEEDR